MADPQKVIQSSTKSQPSVERTSFATAGTVTLLMRPDRTVPTAFNQGLYNDADSRLGVNDAKTGGPRFIKSSGCGLCSLVSYLHAAQLLGPRYDKKTKRFWLDATCKPLDPRSFNRYILNRIESQTSPVLSRDKLIRQVYAPDGQGALKYESKLVEWIEQLVQLHGVSVPKGFVFEEPIKRLTESGRDIPELTAHLDSGDPAILGVAFKNDGVSKHQVLAVGYARIGSKTYYQILDSGWAPQNVTPLTRQCNPIPGKTIRQYSAAPDRFVPNPNPTADKKTLVPGIHQIVWVRPLSGLSSFTRLRPRKDW